VISQKEKKNTILNSVFIVNSSLLYSNNRMTPASTEARHRLFLALVAAGLIKLANADKITTTTGYYAPLAALSTQAPQKVGEQNFTRCCLKAILDWQLEEPLISIQSSQNPSQAFTSPGQFSAANEQFPCGATYQGDASGAPEVSVSYSWCTANCGGWQKSTNAVLTQWIQPFVGFILPAAVFCLNVSTNIFVSPLIQRTMTDFRDQMAGSAKDGLRHLR
jgi:hypothetical protein